MEILFCTGLQFKEQEGFPLTRLFLLPRNVLTVNV